MKINAKKITQLLMLIVVFLTFASVVANILDQLDFSNKLLQEVQESYVRLFVLDREANIPTWFSSALLLLASFLLATIAFFKKKATDSFARYWIALAVIFIYLSMDETAIIHEMAIKPFRYIFHTNSFLRYAWVIPGSILVMLFLIVFFKFLFSLPKSIRNLMIGGGVLYVGGSIGMELISGYFADAYGEASTHYQIITTIEEFFEMSGVVVFIYAQLLYMERELKEIRFRFHDKMS